MQKVSYQEVLFSPVSSTSIVSLFSASLPNHDTFSKITKWSNNPNLHPSFLCLGPLQRVVCRKRVESLVYSFLLTFFLISQSTTSFRVAHIHVSALVREERSKPCTKRIKRVFKLRAPHTLKYLTTYFLLCGTD